MSEQKYIRKMVPAVRMTGYNEEWIRTSIQKICERITRKNTNLESTLPLTISSIYGLVDQYAYFNNRVASVNISNYYLIKNGEFAYNKSSSDGFPFGSVKRLDLYESGVLSTLYIIFSLVSKEITSNFLSCYFSTTLWHKDISEVAAEGARNHGLLNISAGDFFKTSIYYPKDNIEQCCISDYFTNLDVLIKSNERQLEKLRNIKKASLKKMFPIEGETTPEVRLKGFDGEWKGEELGNVFSLKNGYTPSKNNPSFWNNGTLPWFRMEDIRLHGRILNDSIQHITPEAVKNSGLFPNGSFILSTTATIGEHALLNIDSLANQQFTCLIKKADRKENTMYLFYLMYTIGDWCRANINTGGLAAVNINDLMGYKIYIPTIEEQKAIADYFTNLDKLIFAKEKQIERLRNIKQASLKKMFV